MVFAQPWPTPASLCQRKEQSALADYQNRQNSIRWNLANKAVRDMSLIDKNILVSEILSEHPQTVQVFLKYKMLCVGCLVAPFHTIEDACIEHELDEAAFRQDITDAICERPGSA